jgi:phage shock protein A
MIFRKRLSGGSDDPAESLDAAYERQLALLQQVKKARAAMVTAEKQLEAQAARFRTSADRLERQARGAVAGGREDEARRLLERRVGALAELEDAAADAAVLRARCDELASGERELTERLARFRREQETLKASYAAAKAMVAIREAATGLDERMADAGVAARRAHDRTQELQARAAALDELVASGTLGYRLGEE